MPTEIYEIVAQGARYWFLFLMVLIVWRSFRWYRKDRKLRKKRMRLLPDAGYIGEMVVLSGGDQLEKGTAIPVPREGTLGYKRMNDLCLPVQGVAGRHLWFCFERENGLRLEPYYGKQIKVDDEERTGRRHPLYMIHGSRLYVGEAVVRLRLFAGFETRAHAVKEAGQEQPEDGQEQSHQQPMMTREQFLLWQQQMMMQQAQQMMHQQYMQQLAYQQWVQAGGAASGQPMPGMPAQMPYMPPTGGVQGGAAPNGPAGADRAGWANGMQNMAAFDGQAPAGAGQAGWADGAQACEQPFDGTDDEHAYTDEESYDSAYAPEPDFAPMGYSNQIEFETGEEFYLPDGDLDGDDDLWAYAQPPQGEEGYPLPGYQEELDSEDEDLTDAAAPPKSAYVGDDEAERAKKEFWDKYLGGGGAGL